MALLLEVGLVTSALEGSMNPDPFLEREPVSLALTLGELRAISLVLAFSAPKGDEGDEGCEVFAYVLSEVALKLKVALLERIEYGAPVPLLDQRALERSQLDQWRAALSARGLL